MSNIRKKFEDVLNAMVRSRELIPAKHLIQEIELTPIKWPAYRFMSPLKATETFSNAYNEAFRDYIRRNYDIDEAKNTRAGKKLDWSSNNKHLTQMWVARQHADLLGMPYDLYLEFVFDFASRRERKKPPSPNQLRPSSNEQKVAWNYEQEKFWCADRQNNSLIRSPNLPQYYFVNYIGLAAQDAFRDLILQHAKLALFSDENFVGRFHLEKSQLSGTDCISVLGQERFEQARSMAISRQANGWYVSVTYPDIVKIDKAQACFGFVKTHETEHAICVSCPMRSLCQKFADKVDAALELKTGSSDPLLAEKRKKGKQRTALCRERRKNGTPIPPRKTKRQKAEEKREEQGNSLLQRREQQDAS
jgi:hypothetical protein